MLELIICKLISDKLDYNYALMGHTFAFSTKNTTFKPQKQKTMTENIFFAQKEATKKSKKEATEELQPESESSEETASEVDTTQEPEMKEKPQEIVSKQESSGYFDKNEILRQFLEDLSIPKQRVYLKFFYDVSPFFD